MEASESEAARLKGDHEGQTQDDLVRFVSDCEQAGRVVWALLGWKWPLLHQEMCCCGQATRAAIDVA